MNTILPLGEPETSNGIESRRPIPGSFMASNLALENVKAACNLKYILFLLSKLTHGYFISRKKPNNLHIKIKNLESSDLKLKSDKCSLRKVRIAKENIT